MPLFTDDIEFANRFFPKSKFKNSDDNQNNLSGEFFNSGFFIYEDNPLNFFDDIYISKFSPSSQFDILSKITDEKRINKNILCIAGSGKKFHGFKGRAWQALEGNLHISAYFDVNAQIDNFNTGFTILAAVSVIETLDEISEINGIAQIKWVNDIMIDRKKISGVIAKTRIQGMNLSNVIIGVGINVNQTPILSGDIFVKEATCINDEAESDYNEEQIFRLFISRLINNFNLMLSSNYKVLFDKYKQRSELIGENVILMEDNPNNEIIAKGIVTDIGENLELFIDDIPHSRGRILYNLYT